MDMAIDYFSVPQAAVVIGVSPRRILQFVRDNRLKTEKIAGRHLIAKDEVDRFRAVDRQNGRPPQK